MAETDEDPRHAYEVAYDTLSHDLRRDEKLRDRGVRLDNWPKTIVDGKEVYHGHEDRAGQNPHP
eukprot:12074490-Karenia_brevis.AAC.1